MSGGYPYTVAAEVAAPGGAWKACLRPGAVGGDYAITATCTAGCTANATAAVLEHATFGDVWYCGGQSNMALPLLHSYTRNATRDAVLAGRLGNIRIHQAEENMVRFLPWSTLAQALAVTTAGAPAADSDASALMGFSASCFYFAQELSAQLGGAAGNADADAAAAASPIGLVHTAWGGSTIEQWLTNDTIGTCEYGKTGADTQEFHDLNVLPYTSMTLKGWVWYQGENDCHNTMGNAAAGAGYSCLMGALVAQWRQLWSATPGTTDPTAPFGIVSLASSGSEGASSLAMGSMRQAQTAGFGVLPPPASAAAAAGSTAGSAAAASMANAMANTMANTFMAQAYDLDDAWSGDRGPCVATGWNTTSPLHACCDNHGATPANTSSCPADWRAKCAHMCAANAGTAQFMGGTPGRSP